MLYRAPVQFDAPLAHGGGAVEDELIGIDLKIAVGVDTPLIARQGSRCYAQSAVAGMADPAARVG